jgi:hypothetical protein
MTKTYSALEPVIEERKRQDAKWGVQNRDPMEWIAILMEEVGEFSQEALRRHFSGRHNQNLRAELIQVAAVAVAMIEDCDRNGWCR